LNATPNSEDEVNVFKEGGTGFGTWFLLLMNFVPISLLVTLEIC
jgi:hypothetical protein